MPKASFIEQKEGRGKQKSVGGGLFRQLEGVSQLELGERDVLWGVKAGLKCFMVGNPGKPRSEKMLHVRATFLLWVSVQVISASCRCNPAMASKGISLACLLNAKPLCGG